MTAIFFVCGCGREIDSTIKAVRVTGASMSPTLWGEHRLFECPGCRVQWNANWQPDLRPSGAIRCWNCGFDGPMLRQPTREGSVVHIDTAAYQSRLPNIDDMVAIRDGSSVRIKRVVAVAGQVISSRSGLLFRDDQPLISSAPWVIVHDDSFRRGDVSWWQGNSSVLVQKVERGFDMRADDQPALLLYGHRSPYDQLRPDCVRDDYAGNLNESRWLREVTRLGVQAYVDVLAATQLHCWQWTAQGAVCETTTLSRGHHRLDIRWSRLSQDHVQPPPTLDAEHPIALSIQQGSLCIRRLVVRRPIIYWIDEATPAMIKLPLKIKRNHCFVIGDNVPLSVDSRHGAAVTQSQIVGKVVTPAIEDVNETAKFASPTASSDDS